MGSSKLLFFSYSVFPFLATLTLAADPYFRASCINTAGNYTENSTYRANLNSIFSQLNSLTEFNYGFQNLSAGRNPNKVNAIALCRGDRNQDQCNSCLNETISELRQRCPFNKEVIGWSEFCTLRYANRDIFGDMESTPGTCLYNIQDVSNGDKFNQSLNVLLNNLSNRVAAGGPLLKYAADNSSVGVFQTVYALEQCTPDLSEQECGDCLAEAKEWIGDCCLGKIGCRVLRPSCLLRFESRPFYLTPIPLLSPPPSPTSSPPPSTRGKSNKTTRIVIIAIASVVGVLILFSAICIFGRARRSRKEVGSVDEVIRAESLQIDFPTVRAATNNFSDANKLGQGGFGAVYKGQLPNGQEVAVKRLSRDSGQGDREFRNEVLLLAKLQHRNLVRLLSFCLEGHEKLLIYEFVPNKSLDHFIFDPAKRAQLDWKRRYKIIGGIARGLLYLHEDSQLRIIHRDLKASNILLDAKMNPKIADFGMAKLCAVDQTQGATSRIVGTYGYMAPEYAMHGQFSVKSDVFSFGVLLLEILSGQKNSAFHNESNVEDLLSFAWRNWKDGTALDLVDPSLKDSSRTELMKCIHIGLLCVQENVAERPNMASVVLMLTSNTVTLPLPSQPAFFINSNTQSRMLWSQDSSSGTKQSILSRNEAAVVSENEVTITELHPR